MSDKMDDEADKWFYDLGALAKQIDANYQRAMAARAKAEEAERKANTSRHRFMALSAFTLFAFLLLSWRSEIITHRQTLNTRHIAEQQQRSEANSRKIAVNTDLIQAAQRASCLGGLAILKKFNAEQDALIAIETKNLNVNAQIRSARIKAYRDARILPLPICKPLR